MTKFTDEQTKLLQEDLKKSVTSQRKQSGTTLSYIEGHHAINEANRIFGFDGWSLHVDSLQVMGSDEITIGMQKKPGHIVGVMATVTITVGDVSRTDVGYGTDRKTNKSEAFELAGKEAVTDAMKRALRTFGNQFGNALYDKAQTNVVDDTKTKATTKKTKPIEEEKKAAKTTKTEKAAETTEPEGGFKKLIDSLTTEEEFIDFRKNHKEAIKASPDAEKIKKYFIKKKGELK